MDTMNQMERVSRWVRGHERGVVRALAAACVAAMIVRIAIVLGTIGSNDMFTWFDFVIWLRDAGLIQTYRSVEGFNHPPLMGYYAELAGAISQGTGIFFPYIFKVGPVLGDAAVAGLLWRLGRARGRSPVASAAIACAYLWSPIAILISAYHGNTDSMLAAAMLAATMVAVGGRSPFLAGLALGTAINVKIVAVFLIPALWAQQRGRRGILRYGAGLAVAALPFLPVLVQAGPAFYRNAIRYNSSLEHWGVQLLLLQGMQTPHLSALAGGAVTAYAAIGRWVILAYACAVAVLGRHGGRLDALEAAALIMAGFLVLAPGFGIQYVVWVLPLLFAVAPRRAVAYSLVGGAFAFTVYLSYWTGGWAPRSIFHDRYYMGPALLGFWAWLLLLRFIGERLAAAVRRPVVGVAGEIAPRAVWFDGGA